MSGQPSITCPKCRMTSYNPNDIEQGYCGNCHDWTSPPARRAVSDEADLELDQRVLQDVQQPRVSGQDLGDDPDGDLAGYDGGYGPPAGEREMVGHMARCDQGDWSAVVYGSPYTLEVALQEHSQMSGHRMAEARAVYSDGTVYNAAGIEYWELPPAGRTAEVGLEQRLQIDMCEAFHLDNGQRLGCVFVRGHSCPCADRYGRRFGCL